MWWPHCGALHSHVPPPDLATALVRTLCYAWTKSARFYNPVAPCHFCGQDGEDRQAHYLFLALGCRTVLGSATSPRVP